MINITKKRNRYSKGPHGSEQCMTSTTVRDSVSLQARAAASFTEPRCVAMVITEKTGA